MKRPLIAGVIAFILADIVCITFSSSVYIACFSAVLFLLLLSALLGIITRRRAFFYPSLIFGLATLSFALFVFVHMPRIERARSFDGYSGEIVAMVTRIERCEYYTTLYAKTVQIGDSAAKVKLTTTVSYLDDTIKEGDYIELYGTISSSFEKSVMNDTESKLASQNIFVKLKSEYITRSELPSNAIRNAVYLFREKALEEIGKLDNSGLVSALVIGSKDTLEDGLYSDFEKLGLLHTVSISGMHLSIIVMSLYSFLRQRSISKYFVSVICSVTALFYMALTGFSYPITRAGIMMISYLLSLLIRRKNDSLTILFAALMIITAQSPWAIINTGLQLSFFSTLGILCFCSPIIKKLNSTKFFSDKLPQERFKRILTKLKRDVLLALILAITNTLSATISTLPLTLVYYGKFSPFCFIGNVTVLFIIEALLTSSAIYTVVGILRLLPISAVLKPICNLLSSSTLFCANRLASIIPEPIAFSPETAYAIAAVSSIILVVFFIFYRNSRGLFLLMLLLSLTSATVCTVISYTERGTAYVTAATAESCRDVLIEQDGHRTFLSYVNGRSSVSYSLDMLTWRNVFTLDQAVFFFDGDIPSAKIEALINNCSVKELILVPLDYSLSYVDLEIFSQSIDGETSIEVCQAYELSLDGVEIICEREYLAYTVRADNSSTVIVQAFGSTPYPEILETSDGVVIIGDSDFYPSIEIDKYYLVKAFDTECFTEGAQTVDKDFIFMKLGGKSSYAKLFN